MLRSAPMQGSFFRGVPCQLSSKFRNSVSRKVFWSRIARCSDDTSQLINPSSPQPATEERVPALNPVPKLPPLPSRNNERDYSYGRYQPIGSRSLPSPPSIPGKFSKYSKPISRLQTAAAKRVDKKAFRKPMGDVAAQPDPNLRFTSESSASGDSASSNKSRSENIPPRNQIPHWMQQYQYSYSESPTAPILGFRVTPWSPFGPDDLAARPWTGSAPLKPSKKKRVEFDSFNPPPLGKKGVKYVQRPGPFPPGDGPKPGKTREEILGAPLTPLETKEIVDGCNRRSKQLNLGRDGLTHNMLDLVHNHWKRSVCCKIKCKGVPTVDLDNVARVIEVCKDFEAGRRCDTYVYVDLAGENWGIIIHRTGGVMFVFRGRNYNYKDRPRIPIMLWKPPTPIYPKLIQPVPEGFTEEEVAALRAAGRKVAPLCKLAKNGVYMNLVADVRAQFEIDEVVRVDCTGLNPSDYKKIGAKLKDLVPCILISFEKEQIIMCRCKATPPEAEKDENVQPVIEGEESAVDSSNGWTDTAGSMGLSVTDEAVEIVSEDEKTSVLAEDVSSVMPETMKEDILAVDGISEVAHLGTKLDLGDAAPVMNLSIEDASLVTKVNAEDTVSENGIGVCIEETPAMPDLSCDDVGSITYGTITDSMLAANDIVKEAPLVTDGNMYSGTSATYQNEDYTTSVVDDFDDLWQKAIYEGKALQLDNQIADLDAVFEKAAELSEVADGESCSENFEVTQTQESKTPEIPTTSPFDVPPAGGLGLDELAKLLAP